MWQVSELAGAVAAGLRRTEQRLATEQAVHGLDSLDETGLHPMIARGLEGIGGGLLREQPYPGAFARRPLPRDRERCDIVVLPPGTDSLLDPLERLRASDERSGTLFASIPEPQPRGALPEDAFWLEVKSVARTVFVEGVPVDNRGYAGQLVRGPAFDLAKLAREPMIEAGGVLVLLFGAEAEAVRHDLGVMFGAMMDRDLPVSTPAVETIGIADRAGNACVGVCLVPLRAVRDR